VKSYQDDSFYPIPPNRECIESVDMVLHIPLAIDFFYNYLNLRHNPEGTYIFALYIDLIIYEHACKELGIVADRSNQYENGSDTDHLSSSAGFSNDAYDQQRQANTSNYPTTEHFEISQVEFERIKELARSLKEEYLEGDAEY